MKINYIFAVILLLATNLLHTLPVNAGWLDKTTVTPIVGVSLSNLDARRVAATDNRKISFNSLDLTLGLSGEKWFGRINAALPLAPGNFLGGGLGNALVTKRTDYSLSVGREVSPRISIFGGYLYSLTNTISTLGFTVTQIDNGPFIGTSIEMYRGKKSSMSANVAYAFLNGSDNRTKSPATIVWDVAGPTTGLSYGINWTGQLGRSDRIYILSYKIQDFKFEGTGTGGPQTVDKDFGVLTFSMIL